MNDHTQSDALINEIESIIKDYVQCWETGQNHFIMPNISGGIVDSPLKISNTITICEQKYLVFITTGTNITEKFKWRYQIENLPFDVVLKLPAILLHSLRSQTVNYDHKVLWSWLGQLLLNTQMVRKGIDIISDREFINALILLIRVELASIGQPPSTPEIATLNRLISEVVNWNVHEMVSNNHLIALALSFPILERLLKIKCRKFVELDGKVISEFKIQNGKNGKEKTYHQNYIISNLNDLLLLYEEKIATDAVKHEINQFRIQLKSLFPDSEDPLSLIYKWRNNLLHGSGTKPFYHAVILNLLSLITLDSLSPLYDEMANNFKKRPKMPKTGFDPFNLYPPSIF